jgi:cytochrome oxidase assembly protein ShyY1
MKPTNNLLLNNTNRKTTTKNKILGTFLFGGLTTFTFSLGIWQTKRYFDAIKKEKKLATTTSEDMNKQLEINLKDIDLKHAVVVGPRKSPPPSSPSNHSVTNSTGYYIYAPILSSSNILLCLGWTSLLGTDHKTLLPPKERIQLLLESTTNQNQIPLVTCTPGETESGNWFSPTNPIGQGVLLWTNKSDLIRETNILSSQSNKLVGDDDVQIWDVRHGLDPKIFIPRPFHGSGWLNPNIHAGYAITWFSLTLAGIFLTRRVVM